MKLTILKKGLLLVSVPLLFQLVFIGVVAEMQRSNREAQVWSLHSKEVLTQTQAALKSLAEAETSSRGFIITANPVFRAQYRQARQQALTALDQLCELVRDDRKQQDVASQLLENAEEFMLWHSAQHEQFLQGKIEESIGNVKALRGKQQMDAIRQQLASFNVEEERLNANRQQALQSSWRQMNYLVLGGTTIALLITVAAGIIFNCGIRARLHVLTENAHRLAEGKQLAPPLGGSDEITRLDQVFHTMAEELARSQHALRSQTRILESVLNSIGDGVVVCDTSGKFLIFNPAAQQIVGMGPTDAAPLEWSEQYGLYLPDKRTPFPADQVPLTRALRGESSNGVELFVRHSERPHGVWLTVTGRPLRDEHGISGGVVVFSDCTPRKQAEEALRQAHEELEERVALRTAELTAANRDLAQKHQENELFVYSVSHDLRSPLVNLQGFSQELTLVSRTLRDLLSQSEVPSEIRLRGLDLIDSEMAESVQFIGTAVTRLSNIIDSLLRLSRAGRVEYQHQNVSMSEIVTRIAKSMSATAAARKARITIQDLPDAWGDPTAIEQILANLIGNALNYLDPQRSGQIEIGSQERCPVASAPTVEGFTTYYVKDNGVGIRLAYQHKIFEAFQRLHPKLAQGEGIGLTIVRRMVERHGGRIWVESTVDVGSTFFVTLPIAQTAELLGSVDDESAETIERSMRDGVGSTDYSLSGR